MKKHNCFYKDPKEGQEEEVKEPAADAPQGEAGSNESAEAEGAAQE